jgi:hypothetical protein
VDIRDKTDNIDNQDKRHELQRGEVWIREAIKSGQRVRGGGNWLPQLKDYKKIGECPTLCQRWSTQIFIKLRGKPNQ